MTVIQVIILGIVEGITEFLPVSSTGHLILVGKLLGIADTDFTKSFDIAIQLGAILAVVVLYYKKFLINKNVWKKVLTAFLPTAIIGFLFYKIIKEVLFSNSLIVVWSLFLGGILLILFEFLHKNKKDVIDPSNLEKISYKKSFIIGIIQAVSAIPGISRSGATIIGGLLMKINRQAIVEFSFLLAIPTMTTATFYDLYKSAGNFSFSDFHFLLLGFIVSFVVAIAVVKWLIYFIKNHTFISFGVYRIIVAVLFWILAVK